MPSNLEIKARVRDLSHLKRVAAALSNNKSEVLIQEDTFFNCNVGRLKLRQFASNRGELIYYERSDLDKPKLSNYIITPTSDPLALKKNLSTFLEIKGTVRKERLLHLVDQTRIHIDEVENLGCFVELEFVLNDHQDPSEGFIIIKNLMKMLGILEEDLLKEAYIDLLTDVTQ